MSRPLSIQPFQPAPSAGIDGRWEHDLYCSLSDATNTPLEYDEWSANAASKHIAGNDISPEPAHQQKVFVSSSPHSADLQENMTRTSHDVNGDQDMHEAANSDFGKQIKDLKLALEERIISYLDMNGKICSYTLIVPVGSQITVHPAESANVAKQDDVSNEQVPHTEMSIKNVLDEKVVEESLERFKYTDKNGKDVWAFVKTLRDGKAIRVLVNGEESEPPREVEMPIEDDPRCDKGSARKREAYKNVTKYWRDHYVPLDSIERKKPYVLRDAYVPSYSRLSNVAKAWRGSLNLSFNHKRSSIDMQSRGRSGRLLTQKDAYRKFGSSHYHQRKHHHSPPAQPSQVSSRHSRIRINLAANLDVAADTFAYGEKIDYQTASGVSQQFYCVMVTNLPYDVLESDVLVSLQSCSICKRCIF